MEVTAAIEALKTLNQPSKVKVVTDSRYLQGGAARCAYCNVDWKYGRQPEPWKINRDLWLILMDVMKPHRIHWEWVRGHANCAENNRADVLAENARSCS
jgi:ribonuclease HI